MITATWHSCSSLFFKELVWVLFNFIITTTLRCRWRDRRSPSSFPVFLVIFKETEALIGSADWPRLPGREWEDGNKAASLSRGKILVTVYVRVWVFFYPLKSYFSLPFFLGTCETQLWMCFRRDYPRNASHESLLFEEWQ